MESGTRTPFVTIITVVYNSVNLIEDTILNVLSQTYLNKEYIIIDGGSTDGTLDVIEKYRGRIDLFLSEPDKGIYDAMNKGIRLANGEWINFMNAGDRFNGAEVLEHILNSKILPATKFIYSDFIIDNDPYGKAMITADFMGGTILHQSVLYKKELHYTHGFYLVTKKLIVSDYLFFNAVPIDMTMKTNIVISINDGKGVSQGDWCYYQKKSVDYIFGRISFIYFILAICYYQFRILLKFILGKKISNKIDRINSKINYVN